MSKYTARDHAAWRYIMRRAVPFFREHAVHVYEDGLTKTGIPTDRIPSIDFMDESLQKIGWGAVPVCGFIAPWAFLEFQARQILPIATDMRTIDHIGYTPAPDIVHEAAGHAPILPDSEYAEYLEAYGKFCTKAIYSNEDIRLYEAVRYLSDIKEKHGSTAEEIAKAEQNLKVTISNSTFTSEQGRVSRMSWWTNEYGLVGDLKDPKIYGAGLLSSIEESKALYGDHVKKVRLSLDCTKQSFDITKPQPQLFVAEDMQHIIQVLYELESTLAFRVGGLSSLNLAHEAKTVTTTIFDSGVGVSGIVDKIMLDDRGELEYVAWKDQVQLSREGQVISGQGIKRHPHGYSCPLGPIKGLSKAPSAITAADLEALSIEKGRPGVIEYKSGFKLEGELTNIGLKPNTQEIQFLSFKNCKVTKGDDLFYNPAWGEFDLIFGENVPSVHGGPADRESYGEPELSEVSTTPGREVPYTKAETEAFGLYQSLRDYRDQENSSVDDLAPIAKALQSSHKDEWLAKLELVEIVNKAGGAAKPGWYQDVAKSLEEDAKDGSEPTRSLIAQGLALAN